MTVRSNKQYSKRLCKAYCIAGGLAVYLCDRQIKIHQYSLFAYVYIYIYVWQSLTKLPKLNPPIILQWQSGAQPPNSIPVNTFSYTVSELFFSIILLRVQQSQQLYYSSERVTIQGLLIHICYVCLFIWRVVIDSTGRDSIRDYWRHIYNWNMNHTTLWLDQP